jgi:glycosyltransferase involved in cell wall biosynthesis
MPNGRHFLHVFANFGPGGMELRSTAVMGLLPPPHRHSIVAMAGDTGAAERIRGADFELVPAPPRRGFLATARAIAARIRALQPDLVLTYNWGAIEAVLGCRLARHRALIHHEEGFSAAEAVRFLRRRVWCRRLLLPGAARVVVPSALLRRIAVTTWKLRPERVCHLPNGVDLNRYAVRAARHADPVVVGSVARFRLEKDMPGLIEAFARCRHRARARLVLVGEGEELDRTRAFAARRGVAAQVEFRGHVADTAPVYRELDVFAMSSITEQMPLVVLEAMATGLPVVAPAVGDIAAMVSAGNAALIVPPRDPDALAAALDRAIESVELRASIGAANRAHCAARYELGACLRAHLELYGEVIGTPVVT